MDIVNYMFRYNNNPSINHPHPILATPFMHPPEWCQISHENQLHELCVFNALLALNRQKGCWKKVVYPLVILNVMLVTTMFTRLQVCMENVSLYLSGNNFPGIASQFAMHFCKTAIQNIFCVAVFFHRNVQNFI